MTKETKSELTIWAFYFLVAMAAEVGSQVMIFLGHLDSDINIYGYYKLRVEAHLFWWLIIYAVFSGLYFGLLLYGKRRRGRVE